MNSEIFGPYLCKDSGFEKSKHKDLIELEDEKVNSILEQIQTIISCKNEGNFYQQFSIVGLSVIEKTRKDEHALSWFYYD